MLQLARLLSTSSVCQKVTELQFPVPWGHIAAKSWGPREGRPVLCLHGWLDNANSFDRLIPRLPQECHYLAMDFPGHGLSSHRPPGEHYIFPAYVNDVLRVAKALDWKTFSILGHSMGGNVACLFSALFPEMVEKLVILDAYGFLPTETDEIPGLVRTGMEEMLGYESEARFYCRGKSTPQRRRVRELHPHTTTQSCTLTTQHRAAPSHHNTELHPHNTELHPHNTTQSCTLTELPPHNTELPPHTTTQSCTLTPQHRAAPSHHTTELHPHTTTQSCTLTTQSCPLTTHHRAAPSHNTELHPHNTELHPHTTTQSCTLTTHHRAAPSQHRAAPSPSHHNTDHNTELHPRPACAVFSTSTRFIYLQTNIVRITLEQSLQFQKRISASVLIVLAEEGIRKWNKQSLDEVLRGFRESLGESRFRLESVPGNHHVHLNQPENVASITGRFLSSSAWSSSIDTAAKL
ncbi:serine hydrolase-like protein [Polyodon spathula]|uniref:serine hydrolase-like protein n=1 Tax=Polyodon spathula TaxID=7913 RepID=UPI001B7EDF5D|nr:serine hydrolase-like protein [Polyodon spathula]